MEQALGSIREEQAQFVSVQRPAQDGDDVMVSYVPLDDEGKERTSQKVENYPFQLGEGQVVAEFEAAVRGMSPEETARAEVRYDAEHENKEIAGKLVAFVLTLKDVKEKRLPELDDELAVDLGLENLEALRQRVREDLDRRLQQESERDTREKLVDALIAAHSFEVPKSMVERSLDLVVADYEERHRRMQMQLEPEKRDELRQAARPAAERAAKRALVLEQLATEQGLQAGTEEVDAWIEERVQAGGSEAPKVRRFFADPERKRRLRNELTEDRVFEFMKGKAQIVEVPRP